MTKGKLITFEGGEGSGKTTQVALLKNYLEKAGYFVTIAREPGGTLISEQIRQILLDKKNVEIADLTEVLLYQAARAQVYHEVVIPALARGEFVLMDRSRDSSVVYQGIVRGLGVALIENLNDIATNAIVPDLTFLLDVKTKTGLSRKQVEQINRLELEGEAFHQQVNAAYRRLYKLDGLKRMVKINAEQSITAIHDQVIQILQCKNFLK